MVKETVNVTNPTGLHARPASMFVQAAGSFKAKITVYKDGQGINAKSIMGVMSASICQGTSIVIEADGEDEGQALQTLVDLVHSEFGEKKR